jgi:glycogen operon protein
MVTSLATRVTGSSDLYLRDGRKPFHSVNFLTSHDGFTLNDLVSYNGKHNEENGENNRDGSDNNCCYNYGFEGPADNPAIERIRVRQIKNFMLSLLLSIGTPMLLAGDEMRRTQRGNNNAYCQDTPISWIDWTRKKTHQEIFRFTRCAIQFRDRHPAFRRPEFFTGQDNSYNAIPDITWFDHAGNPPDWSKINQFIAYRLDGDKSDILADRDENCFFIMFNSARTDITVKLCPSPRGRKWHRVIDTSYDSPHDFLPPGKEEVLDNQGTYILQSRSSAVLVSR